jgi:Na+-transporting NADH:ubiquinone oxidoreductase subunit F
MSAVHALPKRPSDYSLVGQDAERAVQQGLAEANWYTSPVPRDEMRRLLERRDGPAIRDTLLWFALIFLFGTLGFLTWGSVWAILPFAIYGVLYASTSDSRWHESSHGTAFKTDWMNNVLYEIASFMVLRESVVWRWSHTRHHSDTIIVGRDPEIAVQRPANLPVVIANFFNLMAFRKYVQTLALHLTGRLTPEERSFVPDSAVRGITVRAYIYVLIYAAVIGLAVTSRSLLPLMFIGLPTFYGAWLMVVYGYTQHAGLAENVLDHRLNCRTVYMHWIQRYLYWNMNYHVEHHMYPLVPYHALPRLHELMKADCPPAYGSILAAYREIVPTLLRQAKDPDYFIRRPLPPPAPRLEWSQTAAVVIAPGAPVVDGWIEVCDSSRLGHEDVLRFDHASATYAIYRTAANRLFATEGVCTHGNAHLADGFVKGSLIECAKHNGRFDIRDGSPQRPPVCVALKTFAVRETSGKLYLDLTSAGGLGVSAPATTYAFHVVSNRNVATFIKELVLEPDPGSPTLSYRPGEYLQFNIPVYPPRSLRTTAVDEPYADVWERQGVFDLAAENPIACRRNYSLASNPALESTLRFNVRIATPPPGASGSGRSCPAGAGSSYIFNLKPGDRVTAIGPFGDFLIRNTGREMVYLGGGAGMAPLRAHLSHLLETEKSERRISFWYGARSLQELFYADYFEQLARLNPNFSFHVALSEPLDSDGWTSHTGFIHEVLKREYLAQHPDPRQLDYYLCGPPAMILAARSMLAEFGVPPSQVAYDAF